MYYKILQKPQKEDYSLLKNDLFYTIYEIKIFAT